ncbi:MAG: alpha/beta hydrolase family protein [Solirubrobacteraceae bacterium]
MIVEHETPTGLTRAHLEQVPDARGALILGHGAGGGISAPDLVAAKRAAMGAGVAVVLVEQPYRVAGRRSPAPARQLDVAWISVVERLRERELRDLPLILGGRSSGARVACRTAAMLAARGVLCLAFPFQPPSRRPSALSIPNRLGELEAVPVPVLIVQGSGDPFGIPPRAPGREVITVRGNHSLRSDLGAVEHEVGVWLPVVLASAS